MTKEISKEVVTLRDIAREAGVSAQSVSIVLNGKAKQYRISPATQQRIEKMAEELGYDPEDNRGARQMAARKYGIKMLSNVIAVCSNPGSLPVHQQPYVAEFLDGIESVADEQGLDVLTCRLRTNRLPRMIEKQEVDGIIMLNSKTSQLNALQSLNLPIVKLGSCYTGVHSISAEDYEGTRMTTACLVESGHRQIAYIGHDTSFDVPDSVLLEAAQKRFSGFQAVMEKAQIPVEYYDCTLRESYPEEGVRAFHSLWEQSGGKITAVVCYNDTIAMGVILAARQMGLEVPSDLSVVGFDAVSDRYLFEPFITSVGYDRRQMGKRAVEILTRHRRGEEKLAKEQQEFAREVFAVHFVEGATTAPPRKVS